MEIISINPATGTELDRYPVHRTDEIHKIIEHAHREFIEWKDVSFDRRAKLMSRAAEILEERKSLYAETMTREMGKPIRQSEAEIEKCAWVCRYYAENASSFLAEEVIPTDASRSFVRYDPIGIVLAVMPWNFPFWQVFRFAAPALMAGNGGLLKHASNVPKCALQIEEVFRDAGFPENLFRTLIIPSSAVESVIRDKHVTAVTLTGSDGAGRSVATIAGSCLKKTVLELGGSDPFIILHDADIRSAVRTAVTARLINTGQSCIAAKRFIVVEEVADEFENLFVEEMGRRKMGDPMNPDTEIGPMARKDLVEEIHGQVLRSVEQGAVLRCGGTLIEGEGAFYPATVLTNVQPGMAAFDEEIFGPVAAIIRAKDENDAVALANASPFGLGAAVWTRDLDRGEKLAGYIESGCVFINGMVKSDPRLPFGGVKLSGYGRELSYFGIREFVNIKSVWVA